MSNISEKLKFLRNNRKLNQSYVADLLGLSVASYSDIEREKTKPSIEHISILSKFYGISSDILLGLNIEKGQLTPFYIDSINTEKKTAKKTAIETANTPNYTPNSTPISLVNEGNHPYNAVNQVQVLTEIVASQRQLIEHLSAQIKYLTGK